MSDQLRVRDLRVDPAGLGPVSFAVDAGEVVAVVGRSGSGKTSLLQAIAGLAPAHGGVEIAGERVDGRPPERRPSGMVFETPTLFEHLTVRENVAFGLDPTAGSELERADRIESAMIQLAIGDLGERMPETLSGGQRQRVALARTLVRRPRVLLLDEPLSGVELSLRRGIRRDLLRHVRRSGIAALYVTHDLEEAFAVADRLAVLRDGRLLQLDTPERVYRRPADRAVAAQVGHENILAGTVVSDERDGLVTVRLGRGEVVATAPRDRGPGPAVVVVPAEAVRLTALPGRHDVIGDVAQVIASEFVGNRVTVELETELGTLVVIEWDPEARRAVGEAVRFDVAPGRAWVLPRS